jgi:hypothetical protein
MFEPGTTLRLREPQSTEEAPYPYDRVTVIGQSPIQHSRPTADSPFAGQDAVGYIISPAGEGFGPTLDKPYGELAELYEIESYPTDPATGEPIVPKNVSKGPSPEQAFAQIARDQEVQRRERAPALQNNDKSPEQVLREAEAAAKAKDAAREKRRKAKEEDTGE